MEDDLSKPISCRGLIAGAAALGGLLLAGCSPSGDRQSAGSEAATGPTPSAARNAAMTVYRDPSCDCCGQWAETARQAGYQVTMLDDPDMAAVKEKLGVPPQLASCHTAEIGGYTVEGHVPLDQVDRLLSNKPRNIRGIAVPGMPAGSPGMEGPEGSKDAFQVLAFDPSGRTSVYHNRA